MDSRVLAMVVGLSASTLLAGCDSGAIAGTPPSPVPLASAPDPAIRESVSAAPAFDVGHTVHVTTAGIQPRSLASLCCAPVVFKNETSNPISIVFFIYKIESGPIAPGASWQWVPPNPESVGYHLGSDVNQSGHIQVESSDW